VRGDASLRHTQSYGASGHGRNQASQIKAAVRRKSAMVGIVESDYGSLNDPCDGEDIPNVIVWWSLYPCLGRYRSSAKGRGTGTLSFECEGGRAYDL
jgi:hypothetical protein